MSLMRDERPAPPAPSEAAPSRQEVVVRVDQGRSRRFRTGIVVWLVAIGLAALLIVGTVAAFRGWAVFGSVFAPRTIDRSAPVLVQRLRDASQYTGATGTYSATVEIEHTSGIVPSFIAGSRSVYNGVGTVDATVDLGTLATRVQRDAQGTLVIRLPHATFGDVHLDAGRSHVMSRDRGLIYRIEGVFVDSPTSEREVQQLSERRIAKAATSSGLRARAEHNTARMVEGLASSLGAGPVRVEFGTA
jgi:hypothetical protein